MLANLLPSLRDLRTPLINGYLWFAVGWVLLTHLDAQPNLDRSFSQGVAHFLSIGGNTAPVAALSFAAYIVGGLLSVRSVGPGSRKDSAGSKSRPFARFLVVVNPPVSLTRFVKRIARQRTESSILNRWAADQVRRMALTAETRDAIEADRELPDALRDALLSTVVTRGGVASRDALSHAIAAWVENDEQGALRVRLRLEQNGLFQDHDRLVSEGELRLSIWIPVLLLAIEAGLWQNTWIFAASVASGFLLADGLQIDNQSREILFEALATGAISSPAMDRIQDLASPPSCSHHRAVHLVPLLHAAWRNLGALGEHLSGADK